MIIVVNVKNLLVESFALSPEYHGLLKDYALREEINNKVATPLQIKASLTGNKIFYDNLFNFKTILNIHYSVFNNDYFILDNKISTIFRVSYLENIPVDESFIKNIFSKKSDYYVEFENIPKDEQLRKLRGDLNLIKTIVNGLNEEYRIKPNDKSIEYKISQYQEGYQILQQMVNDLQEEVYSTASKINIEIRKNYETADYKNQIKPEIDELRHMIMQTGHHIEKFNGKQELYMYDYIHTGLKPYNLYYIMRENDATGNLYPFIYPTFVPAQNIIIGNYYDNGVPICKDIWELNEGHNGVIIGMTGSGKSATSKALLVRNLIFKGRKILVLDPQQEYLYTTKIIGGEYINVLQNTKQSNFSINIFDKAMYSTDKETESEFSLKIEDVVTFLSLVVSSEAERFLKDNPIFNQIATDVVMQFYKKYGIEGIKDLSTKEAPTLDEFISYIGNITNEFEQTKVIHFGDVEINDKMINYQNAIKSFELLQSACNTLKMPEYKIFKGKTNVNLSSSFITFNTKGLSAKLEILVIFTIMNYVVRNMYEDLSREKILFIDEGWQILSKFGASYIKTIAKTARKFNMGIIIASQQLSDFNSDEGLALLENSSFAYIYKIKGDDSVSEKAKSFFNLTDGDIEFLKNYTQVGEGTTPLEKSASGILKFGKENYKIKFVLTDTELKFAESNPGKLSIIIPNEIIEIRKKIQVIEKTIQEKEEHSLSTEYEYSIIAYYNDMIDTLREIKTNLEGGTTHELYNEENVRNFVIKNNPIYSVDMSNLKIFENGINMDEINYLLQKGYKKVETKDELKDLFGNEIFYVKAQSNQEMFVYINYLKSLINEYSNLIIGQTIQEQNDLIFKIKVEKENGKYYIYIPKTESSEDWSISNGEITIEKAPKQPIFKNATNTNFIYVYSYDDKKQFIYPIEQEKLLKEKMLYDEKRIQIRTLKDYFTPFAQEDLFSEKQEKYYILFNKLYEEQAKNGSIPKNIFRYDEIEGLFKEIFG